MLDTIHKHICDKLYAAYLSLLTCLCLYIKWNDFTSIYAKYI